MVQYLNGGLKIGLKIACWWSKCMVFEWSAKSRDLTIWILDTHTVGYSDESGIQVFGIQMVTVVIKKKMTDCVYLAPLYVCSNFSMWSFKFVHVWFLFYWMYPKAFFSEKYGFVFSLYLIPFSPRWSNKYFCHDCCVLFVVGACQKGPSTHQTSSFCCMDACFWIPVLLGSVSRSSYIGKDS